jgi:hypothetical protein
MYRKPTQTDIIISDSSCHLYKHKLSSISYLVNRLHTYPITEEVMLLEALKEEIEEEEAAKVKPFDASRAWLHQFQKWQSFINTKIQRGGNKHSISC